MVWSERQAAMLQAMGLRVWGVAPALTSTDAGLSKAQEAPPIESSRMTVQPVGQGSGPVVSMASHPSVTRLQGPLQPAPATARVPALGDVSKLDWSALRLAVAQCKACELCQSRQQTVFGAGHRQAYWMIIGEAPGAQEDAEGEPFVGAAGQLLDNMLRALALSRSAEGEAANSVYMANTLKCRPPSNRNPQPLEMQRCEPFLLRQIDLVQPKIILAMGRFAVQALLRSDEPVGRLRGRVHRFQGVPLVVTYHPAYLLRNLPDKAKAWEDLCFAASVAQRSTQGELRT